MSMMTAAVDGGSVRKSDAFVNNWSNAANDMWGALGLERTWSFSDEGSHIILAWDKTNTGFVNHFVNLLPGGRTFNDVWNNAIKNLSDIKGATKGLGPKRVLDFNL